MYQSHVYLEVRILISSSKRAFCTQDTSTLPKKNANTRKDAESGGGSRDGTFALSVNGIAPSVDAMRIPSVDREVAQKVCMLAHSLGCTVLAQSAFERIIANVSVPSGHEFSPLSLAVAKDGSMSLEFHRRKKIVRIEEIRIEEDAGRLTHSNGVSRMDYTWAGCASVRIRTASDFELGEEAELFLNELRRRIQYMNLTESASVDSTIRCNAYAALARYPEKPSYYVKLRNLNSFNFVRKAINAELDRQEEILSSGGTVESESRLWNERQNHTESYKSRTGDTRRFAPLDVPCVFSFDQTIAAAATGATAGAKDAADTTACTADGNTPPNTGTAARPVTEFAAATPTACADTDSQTADGATGNTTAYASIINAASADGALLNTCATPHADGNTMSSALCTNPAQSSTSVAAPCTKSALSASSVALSVTNPTARTDTESLRPLSLSIIEQPEQRRRRLCSQYGLSRLRAEFICDEKARADFFEQAVAYGADAMTAAHWMSSELTKLLHRSGKRIDETHVTARRFARIMVLLSTGQIHSSIAKQLLQSVNETDCAPDALIEKHNLRQITDSAVLLPLVRQTIAANPNEAEKLRQGDMAPLEFLTGIIMKKTDLLASAPVVKTLLKQELNISIVYVLSMGGAICGSHRTDGAVSVADNRVLRTLLADLDPSIRYQVVSVGNMLSEEIEPADWAPLLAEITNRIGAGTANGIVVAHGTDTLAYTAPLLYWLFSDAKVPIVVTASSFAPDVSDEAKRNLQFAVETACRQKSGVYVAFGQKLLSPLNLKFEKPTDDGFSNWNMNEPIFTGGSGPLSGQFGTLVDADSFVMKQILREAAKAMMVCKVYPGLRAENYVSLIDNGVRYMFLELYETGTASMRSGDYSLKPLLIKGRKKGCRFFCTSQQQSKLDFSVYTTSRRVWREGAVPMGSLTTETAVALYYAASLVCDSDDELNQCMEAYAELFE